MILTYIIRSKAEPASARIKRLLQVLGVFSFNLCYMKGKDMIPNCFLSKIKVDKLNADEIIPMLLCWQKVLWEKYCIYRRSGAKKAGIIVENAWSGYTFSPSYETRKIAKVVSKVPIGTDMGQPHLVTNPAIRKGLGRAGLISKVSGTQ